jgi:hypothetical protein
LIEYWLDEARIMVLLAAEHLSVVSSSETKLLSLIVAKCYRLEGENTSLLYDPDFKGPEEIVSAWIIRRVDAEIIM